MYTLGHDPVLGWLFGTANILTDCITWEIYEKNKETRFFYLDEEKQKVCERSIPETKEERMIKWIENNHWDKLHSVIKAIIQINFSLHISSKGTY